MKTNASLREMRSIVEQEVTKLGTQLASIIEKSEIALSFSLFFISKVGFVPAPKTF